MIKSYKRYYVDTQDQRTKKSNGRLYSIWKHYETQRELPPMEVYMTTFAPLVLKGPHLHKTRWDYFTCIRGKVLIVVKDHDGKYCEFISSEDNPITVEVPANIPSATLNLTNETAMVLNLCNPAWHPENEDNYNLEFEDYDFEKARKKHGGEKNEI
jgi:dTDP-4-dehydrorhamnose 3,5-epimerase-like enzyme